MIFYKFSWYLQRTFLMALWALTMTPVIASDALLSLDAPINNNHSSEKVVTIEIGPDASMPLWEHPPSSQYDQAFGRGPAGIFNLIQPTAWQREIANYVMGFDREIYDLGIHQNYAIVSLSVQGEEEDSRYYVPHIFFSGNAEKVCEKAFMNTDHIRYYLEDSSNLIKKDYFYDASPTPYARGKTLQFLVEKYFSHIFYTMDQATFFIFPIHPFVLDHLDHSNESDVLTCKFRKFIYGHFAQGKDQDIKAIKEKNQVLFKMLNNTISHANTNTHSHTLYKTQKNIMHTVLAENYIRSDNYSQDRLRSHFDLTSFDDVFGKTSPDSRHADSSTISKCFVQSEQAFLKMMLLDNKISIKQFIISYISHHTDKIKLSKSDIAPLELNTAIELEGIHDDEEPSGDEEESSEGYGLFGTFEENVEEIPPSTFPQEDNQLPAYEGLEFTFEAPIVMDIFSPRHICKFCRGSLLLRKDDLKTLIGKSIIIEEPDKNFIKNAYRDLTPEEKEKILADDRGELKCVKDDATVPQMYNLFYLRRHTTKRYADFVFNYQKKIIYDFLKSNSQLEGYISKGKATIQLKNVSLRILATSFKEADDDIMGVVR